MRHRKQAQVAAGILAVAGLLALALLAGPPAGAARIDAGKHNLSASGPGKVRATSESEVCIFCHVAHTPKPSGQRWSRRLPTTTYTPYASSTLKSVPGQPNGSSLLCLSCHDGTIALGEVLKRPAPIGMAGGGLTGRALLGTDLSDDHPVSFVYDAALRAASGELADPSTLRHPGKVRLDGAGRLQCTTCHDAHDNANPKFLVMPNNGSALCVTCHQKNYWAGSDHRNSSRTWNGMGANPWPYGTGTTVAANACENCHQPHAAGGAKGLLNHASEEANCLSCHNGNAAARNIQAELSKSSTHAVGNTTGVHSPAEPDPVTTPHVECVDCHNPHAAQATPLPGKGGSAPPALPGSLAGVKGVNIGGAAVATAQYEYEICLRCHGATNTVPSRTSRQIAQTDKRLEFETGNPSFHPVAGAGRSASVPSLLSPWTTASRLTCTDCHNNNASPYSSGSGATASGTGANGPHGSTYPALLERQYLTGDGTPESQAAYALCYKCHSRTSILADQSGSFREHRKHIEGARTPCNVCHDPHGVSAAQGNATNNARLINFDTAVVQRLGSGTYAGQLKWVQTAPGRGTCYLRCHDKDHAPLGY